MSNVRFIGLDVHKDSIAVAIAEPQGGDPTLATVLPNDTPKVLKFLKRLGPVRCCYEAGPTGYGLQRALLAAGIDCMVVAPSLVPSRAGDHVKTDRKDAQRLARFLRSGDLTPLYVPSEEVEAIRDLERAREDAVRAQRSARQQMKLFLLRHGRRYDDGGSWTYRYMRWLRVQSFEHSAGQRTFESYLDTIDHATARVEKLTTAIEELIEKSTLRPLVKALQALRGVRLITAVVIAAELGDLHRFGTAPQLMGYLGLVPCEHSSGNTTHRGRITRAGNGHVRKALVEAAWAYRFRERTTKAILERSQEVSSEVKQIAWRAQERLCKRYRKLSGRGMRPQRVVVAIARELAGFVWEIGQADKLLAA